MKKNGASLIICISCLLAAFTIGFFLGRNSFRGDVQISVPDESISPASGVLTRSAPDAPVNINTATVQELMTLPGIGESLARRIIDYREEHGGFRTETELGNVEGIGDSRLEALLDLITVGG